MWQVQGMLNISTCPFFLRRKRLLWFETTKTSKNCQSTSLLFLECYPSSFMTTVSQANPELLKFEDHNMCHMKVAFNIAKYNAKPQEGISMLRCLWVKLQARYASNTSSIIVPSYQFLFVNLLCGVCPPISITFIAESCLMWWSRCTCLLC